MDVVFGVTLFDPDARTLRRGGVALEGGRIAAVLDDAAAREAASREGVRAFDGEGGVLMPGFVDAHLHLMALALSALRCDLSGARGADEVVERLREWAAKHPDGPVVGVDWDDSGWSERERITRRHLDAVSRERAVFARRVCCHVGVVNSALLERLDGGAHVDAESGRVTEQAAFDASRLTAPDDAARAAAIPGAVSRLYALGVTGFCDVVEPDSLDAWVEGLSRCEVPPRVGALVHAPPESFADLAARVERAPRARALGIKRFADGSFGARTAALDEPYADGDGRGELLLDRARIERDARAALEGGFACAVHAIGDRAVREVAEAFAAARSKAPASNPGAELRIEHAELVDADALAAVRRAGAVLVMQPNFVVQWGAPGALYERRLGRERWRAHNAFGALVEAGVEVAFSSDGMPAGPLVGLPGAVAHPVAASRLEPTAALAAYTRVAARRLGTDDAGRLARGAPADLVLVSREVLDDASRARVAATWVGGRRVA